MCACFWFFSHTSKAKTQNLFFLLGVGEDIICKRDRWWVYWVLIIYTLLLPWQFSTLIYIFFRNVENLSFLVFFFPSNKKILKENIEHSRNFVWSKWFFNLFIYLFDKHFLKLATKICSFFKKLINYLTNVGSTCQGITIYDFGFTPPPPQNNLGGILEKIYLFNVLF
jgi:hypothetical protein